MMSFNPNAAPIPEADAEEFRFDDGMDEYPSEVVYETLDELMNETGLGAEALKEHRVTKSTE